MDPVSLGPDDLVLCAGTLARVGLVERAAAAARAGFTAVSLFLDDLEQARAAGHSDADLRAVLAEHGLVVAELDPLLCWAPGTAPDSGAAGFFRYREEDFYAAAEAVGARSINAALFASQAIEEEALVEAFAGLCDRAAERGLLVHLEFMPFSQVRDVNVALEIVATADRPNGGLMFDAWHHFRSDVPNDVLRRAAPLILATQLDDATAEPGANLVHETLHGRLVPGEGAIDLTGILRILEEGGCRAPLGVEVFSDELRELPAEEVARRVGDAARAVRDGARAR